MTSYSDTNTTRKTPHSIDWPLVWTILTVTSILFLQTLTVFTLLHLHAARREAHWKRLRDRGHVFVHGPTLIWAHDLPPQPTFSTFMLQKSGPRMESGGV